MGRPAVIFGGSSNIHVFISVHYPEYALLAERATLSICAGADDIV